MTEDKRKVSTDALETLGMIISEDEKRDAIHLAVEPVQATVKVYPGQDVNSKGLPEEPFVGIVDPFLKNPVHPEQWFWLVIYPRQIHSLRHVWTHPEFDDEVIKKESNPVDLIEESKKWIEIYADSVGDGYSYETIMGYADNYIKTGRDDAEYLVGEDSMEGEYTSDEFWSHYEIVRGIKLKEDEKGNFFGCAC